MTEAMCLHLMLGKSPRKWLGAVGTPYRSRLWNHSPSSSMRRARASRSICGGAVVLFVLVSCRWPMDIRSEEHTSELQSHVNLVCRLLLEKKKIKKRRRVHN